MYRTVSFLNTLPKIPYNFQGIHLPFWIYEIVMNIQ